MPYLEYVGANSHAQNQGRKHGESPVDMAC